MMKIGEAAQRAGVSVRALRYYEDQGLLSVDRTLAGQRVYDDAVVGRVRFFQQLYAAGLSSSHIAQLLPCVASGHTDAEQRAMLDEQRARIKDRLDDLTTALARLDELIAVTDSHP